MDNTESKPSGSGYCGAGGAASSTGNIELESCLKQDTGEEGQEVVIVDQDGYLLPTLEAEENGSSCGSASTISSVSPCPSPPPLIKVGTRSSNNNNSAAKGTSAATGAKRKKVAAKSKVTQNKDYKYVCMAKEDHGQPIFGCAFRHQRTEGEPLILATVGSNRISIYECLDAGQLKMLQVFADPDSDEIFYCCVWTDDEDGKPLLAAAGARGIIRIISTSDAASVKHFFGHGHAINDLLFHPKDPNLLLSASKDHSLRLYNIKTELLVAIFGGVEGHRDEVLGADIDITGSRIVSAGMDHSLKVWKLNRPEVQNAILSSYTYNAKSSKSFPTVRQNFPDFSTRDIHRNYVDCTKWFGDFILSKSCENSIICWKVGKPCQKWEDINLSTAETTFLHRLDIKECEIWFIRFSMDYWKKTLALGNQNGITYLYDISPKEPKDIKTTVLSHPKCNSAIRQTALSRDGKVLICICDDSTIWRWDKKEDDNE